MIVMGWAQLLSMSPGRSAAGREVLEVASGVDGLPSLVLQMCSRKVLQICNA